MLFYSNSLASISVRKVGHPERVLERYIMNETFFIKQNLVNGKQKMWSATLCLGEYCSPTPNTGVDYEYLDKYPEQRQPGKSIFRRLEFNLKEFGSFTKPVLSRQNESDNEKANTVLQAENPEISTRQIEHRVLVQLENVTLHLPTIYNSRSNLLNKQNQGKRAPQIIAALIASLTAFSVGTTIAWTSQISEKLVEGTDYPFFVTDDELGWIGSLMPLGASLLSLFTGSLCDLIGRKSTGLILVLPAVMGWSLIIWSKSIVTLYVGRFISGMASGGFCVFTSLYNHEVAQKEVRGTLGSFLQMMISSGILFAVVVAKFLPIKSYTIVCCSIPLIYACLFIWMPETPFYYLKKDKIAEARRVLLKLRGSNYDIDKEIAEIQTCIQENTYHGGVRVIVECLKKRQSQIACIIGFGLMIFKTINGVDAITTYTSYILTNVNIGINAQTGTIILNTIQVATAVVQSFVVEKSGRRILLIISSGAMTICLLTVGICVTLKQEELISPEYFEYIDYFPLIALIILNLSFSFGLGPIPWLMMGEIFPQEIKATASSLATFVSWVLTFAVTKLFLVVDTHLGVDIAFYIFSVCTLLSLVFTLTLVPETKNKTYKEIQESL
ncbi:hypothetical protein FQA39_LY15512 [Lamprigera yunnana]|nr:hypothetical protein FQA39_LY15512 [Lamprigera yunnana]